MMRTEKQIEKRRHRTQCANLLLSWMQSNQLNKGTSVIKQIIEPFQREKDLKPYECWRAFEILKEAGRIKTVSGGGFTVNDFDAVTFHEDGSIK